MGPILMLSLGRDPTVSDACLNNICYRQLRHVPNRLVSRELSFKEMSLSFFLSFFLSISLSLKMFKAVKDFRRRTKTELIFEDSQCDQMME